MLIANWTGRGSHKLLSFIKVSEAYRDVHVPLGLKFLGHWLIVPLTGLRTLIHAILKSWCHNVLTTVLLGQSEK